MQLTLYPIVPLSPNVFIHRPAGAHALPYSVLLIPSFYEHTVMEATTPIFASPKIELTLFYNEYVKLIGSSLLKRCQKNPPSIFYS